MERIETLIQNLNQQLLNKASNTQLLATAELLVSELRSPLNVVSAKVSVIMPYVYVQKNVSEILDAKIFDKNGSLAEIQQELQQELQVQSINEAVSETIDEVSIADNAIITEELDTVEEKIIKEETPIHTLLKKPTQVLAEAVDSFFPSRAKLNFNEMLENLPTFSNQPNAQKQIFELNDTIVDDEEESLNDLLKNQVQEVGYAIKEAPIKDIRKAIGVNDKYLFINELFKGDELMYEKCIKTINGFSVFPEAQTWIKRELLVKMSWDENASITKQFYHIVERRFA